MSQALPVSHLGSVDDKAVSDIQIPKCTTCISVPKHLSLQPCEQMSYILRNANSHGYFNGLEMSIMITTIFQPASQFRHFYTLQFDINRKQCEFIRQYFPIVSEIINEYHNLKGKNRQIHR